MGEGKACPPPGLGLDREKPGFPSLQRRIWRKTGFHCSPGAGRGDGGGGEKPGSLPARPAWRVTRLQPTPGNRASEMGLPGLAAAPATAPDAGSGAARSWQREGRRAARIEGPCRALPAPCARRPGALLRHRAVCAVPGAGFRAPSTTPGHLPR